jgi:hypothetical protein
MSALSIAAALVVLIVALGIIGWSGGWFGSRAPEMAPAATTTEQGGGEQQPSSTPQPSSTQQQ